MTYEPAYPRTPPPHSIPRPRVIKQATPKCMTLIAGFRCADGFVIAGDTEITLGSTVVQGHKLRSYNGGEGKPYFIRIGIAGGEDYALSACEDIRDAVAALPSATFSEIKLAVREVLEVIYHDRIFPLWAATGQQLEPEIYLILGVEDVNGHFGVLKTDRNNVREVDGYACAGSGSQVAEVFIERLFRGFQFATATTEHLALQIFREVKVKGAYVGGNTETISRRSLTGAPFFDLPSSKDDRRFLWGIDEMMADAVRVALTSEDPFFVTKDLRLQMAEHLREIKAKLDGLWKDSHGYQYRNLRERSSAEYGVTGFANPFKDDRT
jgi:ATP-dependent protease HslVU (ClpYQ) peptidase subunit